MSLYCHIKKKIGRFLLHVQFEAENETVALMGASGCGKSMTLRCIAGIEKPDSGKIIINGKTVYDSEKKINLVPQKRKTGYLFQDFALFPNMTVQKNIQAVLPKDKKDRINSILAAFHLEGLENHYPSQLSGGQKQRCALARMIVSEPEIIMLDEPFSALDSHLRWMLEQEVVSVIKDFGKTVLFVSHDRDEVYRISDRVVVIENGTNEPIRAKQELYRNPRTYADALLTGCKNIIPVQIKDKQVSAPEYGIQFTDENTRGGLVDFSYMGIRAKQIMPAHLVPKDVNALYLPYTIISITEAVFSMIVMVSVEGGEKFLRWEIPKGDYEELHKHPKLLAIPYENMMFLKEKL